MSVLVRSCLVLSGLVRSCQVLSGLVRSWAWQNAPHRTRFPIFLTLCYLLALYFITIRMINNSSHLSASLPWASTRLQSKHAMLLVHECCTAALWRYLALCAISLTSTFIHSTRHQRYRQCHCMGRPGLWPLSLVNFNHEWEGKDGRCLLYVHVDY